MEELSDKKRAAVALMLQGFSMGEAADPIDARESKNGDIGVGAAGSFA